MKIEKLHIHASPVGELSSCRMLTKNLVIVEPDFPSKIPMCLQNEELVLQQIPPSMWEMRKWQKLPTRRRCR